MIKFKEFLSSSSAIDESRSKEYAKRQTLLALKRRARTIKETNDIQTKLDLMAEMLADLSALV